MHPSGTNIRFLAAASAGHVLLTSQVCDSIRIVSYLYRLCTLPYPLLSRVGDKNWQPCGRRRVDPLPKLANLAESLPASPLRGHCLLPGPVFSSPPRGVPTSGRRSVGKFCCIYTLPRVFYCSFSAVRDLICMK